MAAPGEFAGKQSFASTGVEAFVYLSYMEFRLGNGRSILLPAMCATSLSKSTLVTLYQVPQSSDQYFCQLANGQWISFDASTGLNWLTLDENPDNAIPISFSGTTQNRVWKIDIGNGPQQVYYSTETAAPLLTLNETPSSGEAFTVSITTPSLASMRVSGGKNADLENVDFDSQDLSNIDFTQANFSNARLNGANCDNTVLTKAIFHHTVWGSATANNAVLDEADLTTAVLTDAAWGKPKSAKNITLSSVQAERSTLGNHDTTLDMSGAVVTGANFSHADISNVDLTRATLSDSRFDGCIFNGSKLDHAKLRQSLFLHAKLRNCTLTHVSAQGANFTGADLSYAVLTKAQLGSRSFLFYLDSKFISVLDNNSYPQPSLISAFASHGVSLSDQAPIIVIIESKSWMIEDDDTGPFSLLIDENGMIGVYRQTDLAPASLAQAICLDTQASSANFAGANMVGIAWYGTGATLDHADLQSANLSNSLMVSTNLTQAFLSGANFTNSILCQANMSGTVVASGCVAEPTQFNYAHTEGVSFDDATLISANFVSAGIALPMGVPLFTMPCSERSNLNNAGMPKLSPFFTAAGFPFGDNATIETVKFWDINNAADPDKSSPASYVVELSAGKYQVFDGINGRYLFLLSSTFAPQLNAATASATLVSGFQSAGYSLVEGAPISSGSKWMITAAPDSGFIRNVNYGYFTIFANTDNLNVYGSVLLKLRDWSNYPGGIAFSGTSQFDLSISSQVLGPAGYPYSLVKSGEISLLDYLFMA